jgi:hypothetical protein
MGDSMNEGITGNTRFSTYLIGAISIGALCAIGLMVLYNDLNLPAAPSPEQLVENQPTAALPPSSTVNVPAPDAVKAPLPTEILDTAPVAAVIAPAGEAAVAAAPPVQTNKSTPAQDELLRTLEAWRKAWASRDVETYFSFYAADFAGTAESPALWQASRRRIIDQAGQIDLSFGEARIEMDGQDRAILSFPMNYRSARFQDEGIKQLQLVRDQGQWRIAQEKFTAN